MTQRVVSIVGPTASGKTGLGIAIARRLAEAGERAEIVNADAYQMYRGMDIGTAKPTAEEQAAVPHHLIDIIDPEDTMSVARFQQLARETIADLRNARKPRVPVLCSTSCGPKTPRPPRAWTHAIHAAPSVRWRSSSLPANRIRPVCRATGT